ncbi:pleckstrin homology domain-containing family G member 3, partial [Notolabrus celidotus]|uniref:pleckstrin homology domain-containing family G member 3 n=1 Tax=Notolabrus celidotus TaxID=1203425 RepID=UPI00148FF7EB
MNYPNSVAVLRECMKNKTLVCFFQERQTTLNHSLPLETYLLKPVQRILKYHLLLQELLKHFDKSDPGYEVVEDAIITMTAVAWYINDMKRKQEHAVRLQEIESLLVNWTGPDLCGFGELVLEGSFKVQRVKKERAFFLFDKMLLIAKKRLEQFVYSTHIFCCNLLLVETLKDPLCFKVSDQTIPKQQHVVQTKNQEEKRLWSHYLKRLIVENHPASLPQKARQVLGDNFCQSPQFDQENLKKSSALSRFDDIHSYHRGRRQSEPPELLMYTPEKSRKSLPLLLEGNLPYRRTRRQSAPAKDIESAFHPNALKQAGSEGELCQAESLGLASSSSTLASSVIEVEAERTEAGLMPQKQNRKQQEEEEDEEEELTSLSPPPTLSITEEILEFINQSRAREGLAAIRSDPKEDVQDPPKDSQPSSDQTNFTCPLPPVACTSSPEQSLTGEQEQESAEVKSDVALQSQTGRSGEERNKKTTDEAEDALGEPSPAEKGPEAVGGTLGELVEKETEEEKTRDEEEEGGGNITAAQTPDPHPSITIEEEPVFLPKEEEHTEAATPTQNPDTIRHPLQRRHPPTRGAHLTKRDQKIIEKIRSYYEAAAEAEEDEEEEEDEQGEGGASKRRNSFSQIPSGLVKDSVSRFDVSEHQGEPEVAPSSASETSEVLKRGTESELCSPVSPVIPDTVPAADDDSPASGFVEGSIKSPTSSIMQDMITEERECQDQQSDFKRPDGEEAEIQDKNGGRLEEEEEEEEEETCVGGLQQAEGPPVPKQCRDQTTKTSPGNPAVMNGQEPNQESPAEPKGSLKEPSKPLTKTQTMMARTKQQELTKTSGNLEGLPSQIKVGRWSRHSRIVTANRALFEGMTSDITGIRLFEAGPAEDPILLENSERILSKVQTLAKMYGAKASTMKVPLHQKRASAVRNQSLISGRLSGLSTQTQTEGKTHQVKSQTRMQTPIEYRQQTMRESVSTRTQTLPETKAQSQTTTQPAHTKTQAWSQAQTYYQSQNQSKTYQGQTLTRVDRAIQEKRIRRAHSLTTDLQETAVTPSEPLLFGHVFVKEQLSLTCHQQANGVILSRPRDFISALTKDRDPQVGCGSDDIPQPLTGDSSCAPTREESSSIQSYNSEHSWADKSSTASRSHLRTQPEEERFV